MRISPEDRKLKSIKIKKRRFTSMICDVCHYSIKKEPMWQCNRFSTHDICMKCAPTVYDAYTIIWDNPYPQAK